MFSTKLRLSFLLFVFYSITIIGCSETPTIASIQGDGQYKSYNPSNNNRGYDGYESNGINNTNNANNVNNSTVGPDKESDPNREITEADIIKVEGDTLYALSAYRGLVVMDLSTQDSIQVTGRFPVYGTPFEMYLKDGLAYVMFSSFWFYEWDDDLGYGVWNSTSKMVVLNIQDPSNITQVASYNLAGEISDSRMVGEIIYMVASENGYCWHCSDLPRTTITSVSTGDIDSIEMVDQISFEGEDYSWQQPSIFVNQDRIYVAERDWNLGRSSIQIVDISEPSGVMSLGTSVLAAGIIESRWQMNEYNNVFRVLSQRGWNGEAPIVETFSITENNQLLPLGNLTMILPRPEDLRSVRFDGDRAYAVTFEQVDPLFTIDLSDPQTPVQRGELEIPGWLHHMEPRGDRMIALGFDNENGQQLTMSLFDVSDLDNPTMIARENFGAQYSYLTEDQDRIHKALKILDSEGLILMPYAGWGEGGYQSGVQIFSFTENTLIKRGLVPHYGFARRAFIHNYRLFAMSDERVESFDFTNLDTPIKTASRVLARSIYNFATFGDGYIAQLSMDWWSHEARIDITSEENPDSMEPVGSIALSSLVEESSPYDYWYYGFDYYRTKLFAKDNHVFLIRGESPWWWYDESGVDPDFSPTHLMAFDVSDPSNPTLVSTTDFPHSFPWQMGSWYTNTVESGDNIVMVENTIVIKPDNDNYWYYDNNNNNQDPAIYGIDVSDPLNPVISFEVARQEGVIYGGLQSKGNLLVTSHFQPLTTTPDDPFSNMVLFYMDRIDLTHAASPSFMPAVNIPGSLIDFNPNTNKVITVDYILNSIQANNWDTCYEMNHYNIWYDDDMGRCFWVNRTMDILNLAGNTAYIAHIKSYSDGYISNVQATDTRIFVELANNYYYWYYETEDGAQNRDPRPILKTIKVDGLFSYPTINSMYLSNPWSQLRSAYGTSALITQNSPPSMAIIDSSDPDDVNVATEQLLTGYSYSVLMDADRVISANSMWGVQVIDY
jgi:uncharacterized secreted protein with C-terminal beta-propeller domain